MSDEGEHGRTRGGRQGRHDYDGRTTMGRTMGRKGQGGRMGQTRGGAGQMTSGVGWMAEQRRTKEAGRGAERRKQSQMTRTRSDGREQRLDSR